jgi:hypothetical protein
MSFKYTRYSQRDNPEHSIIPVINKIDLVDDGMDGVGPSNDRVILVFRDEEITIRESDIHHVSSLNAEYVFHTGGGIPWERLRQVRKSKGKAKMDKEDLKIKYEEESYAQELSDFFYKFAVYGKLMSSAELFSKCMEYCAEYMNLLKD